MYTREKLFYAAPDMMELRSDLDSILCSSPFGLDNEAGTIIGEDNDHTYNF